MSRAIKKGDIVVLMKRCKPGCYACTEYSGETAEVVRTYNPAQLVGEGRYSLLFAGGSELTGFQARNLYNTGLTV